MHTLTAGKQAAIGSPCCKTDHNVGAALSIDGLLRLRYEYKDYFAALYVMCVLAYGTRPERGREIREVPGSKLGTWFPDLLGTQRVE